MTGTAAHRQRPPVVVVGLDCITGMQTARVYARRGIPVFGVARDAGHFCCRTRACKQLYTTDIDGPALIDCLLSIAAELEEKLVLIPCTDNCVLQIAHHRQRLEPWYYFAQPAPETIERLTDKSRFPQFATEHGLPIPKSFNLTTLADAQTSAREVTYPAVLKPAIKTVFWLNHTNKKAVIVNSADELLAAFEHYSVWTRTLLLQEWIPGPLENHYTCDAYFDAHSRPLVTFTSHKLRQWPPHTGVGSISQECDNETVRREAIRLFQAAGFHGLGYVEMKRHERTGEYLIIEPNVGRPTGRSTCAEATSVEMLYTMYCDLVGLPLPANRQQHFTATKWIYWKRDLRASWDLWRRGELTLPDWWRSTRGPKACAVFSWSDPVPFLADWLRVIRKPVEPMTGQARTHTATGLPPGNQLTASTDAPRGNRSDAAAANPIPTDAEAAIGAASTALSNSESALHGGRQ